MLINNHIQLTRMFDRRTLLGHLTSHHLISSFRDIINMLCVRNTISINYKGVKQLAGLIKTDIHGMNVSCAMKLFV